MFLNLETLEFYCLPDNYQIIDSSLEDIKVSSLSLPLPLTLSPCTVCAETNLLRGACGKS